MKKNTVKTFFISLLRKVFFSKSKEKFFIPSTPEPNFTLENTEHAILPLAECSCCGWIKPLPVLYQKVKTEVYWSNMEVDFIEENITKLYCKNCLENNV